MPEIEWSRTFEIGVKEIDDQHRKLFMLVKKIHHAIESKDDELCRATIQMFVDTAEKHFEREERFLARVAFPEIEEHKTYHATLLIKAKELMNACGENARPGEAKNCYEAVVGFLIDDIVRGDSNIKSFVEHMGLTDRKRSSA